MAKVAVLKTNPEAVLQDYQRIMELAEYKKFLPQDKETIIKLNLSWSLYYPACSTQPWQLEGILKTLRENGYKHLHAMENKTVVTDVWKGARGNKWLPILKKYGLPYEPLTEVKWVSYKPKTELLALDEIFAEGQMIPECFLGKNVLHPPTIKCVHPDTQIFLADGSLTKIKDIVETIFTKETSLLLEDGDSVLEQSFGVYTLEKSGIVSQKNVSYVWKTPSPKKLYYIKTKTDASVKVSSKHPFLTPSGWKAAQDLKVGDRIAIPRRLYFEGKSQKLAPINILNHKNIEPYIMPIQVSRSFSIAQQREIISRYLQGETTTEIAKSLSVHSEKIRKVLLKNNISIRWRHSWVSVPAYSSPDFWRWLGYFIAEGYAKNCNGSMRFWWTNGNTKIVLDYLSLTQNLFGIRAKLKKGNEKHIDSWYFDANKLVPFFENLGFSFPMIANTKTLPSLLFKCPKEEIAAFLQGYLDGDGTVGKDGLHVTSKSFQLISQIKFLLLRLGIISFIKESWSIATNGKMAKKECYWVLSVYADDLVRLAPYIPLYSQNKMESIDILLKKRVLSKKPSNWDTIPIDKKLFRKVRVGLGFTQQSTGNALGVNNIENSYKFPTRDTFKYFVALFDKTDLTKKYHAEIAYFKFLLSDDIVWDHIREVSLQDSDVEYLYDFSVPETECFIGNGIILHNTHGHTMMTGAMKNAFGGLITEKRHHCHKKIHEVLVDLLAIQQEIHPGIFAVMDGTVAGDGAGPRTMIPKVKNYILASGDQVAIDAISAKMMGYDPMKIKFIKLAHDRGLGCGDVDQIEIVGEDISNVNFHFSTNKSPVIFWDQMLRKGPLSFVEPALFHTGLFKGAIFGSAFYHDYLWYNLIGRSRIRAFKKTPWGKLWKSYRY